MYILCSYNYIFNFSRSYNLAMEHVMKPKKKDKKRGEGMCVYVCLTRRSYIKQIRTDQPGFVFPFFPLVHYSLNYYD